MNKGARQVLQVPGILGKWVLLALLTFYKYLVSPALHTLAPGSGCRYFPTCSDYAMEAVRRHGPIRGFWLALRRISRCHPWGGHGFDPVPETCSCREQSVRQHSSPLTPCRGHHHPVSGK